MLGIMTVRSWVGNDEVTFQNNRLNTALRFLFVAAGLILEWEGEKSRKCGDKAAVRVVEVSLTCCVAFSFYKMGKHSAKLRVIKVLEGPLHAKCGSD